MTATRDEVLGWVDELLAVKTSGDYSPIGLLVEGRAEGRRVALAVSAHLEVIERAASWGADALLVHHGFFWKGEPQLLAGWRKARIKALLEADMTLASYHLPLDGHPEVGNNACLADLLGGFPAEGRRPFAKAGGQPIGLLATGEARPLTSILAALERGLGATGIVFPYGPEAVHTVAIVSGGGASYYEEARALGAQLFLTGEAREPNMAEARETGTHFIAAGHYNTETLGIQALGARLGARFPGVEVRFFAAPNPV